VVFAGFFADGKVSCFWIGGQFLVIDSRLGLEWCIGGKFGILAGNFPTWKI
jgi:hypothetical protein